VRVLNLKADREQTFHLVSPNEVDPSNGKISIESPVGQAVINHGPGDEVTVNAPSGQLQLRVIEVIG
jgi:transcription elongation factor GreA